MAVQLSEHWNQAIWDGVGRIVAAGVPVTPEIVRVEPGKPRQFQHRLQAEEVAALVADYRAGMSIGGLARKYRVRHETARRWLVVNAVEIRPVPAGFPVERTEEAVALRKQGWSWHRLGREFGCSHMAVRRAVLALLGSR